MVNLGVWLLIGSVLGALFGLSLDRRHWWALLFPIAMGSAGAVLGGWLGRQGVESAPGLDMRALIAAVAGATLLLFWTHWRRIRSGC
jgi:uncharacterized membrane protein YeaQ/YmgE (transglycosylase-associated protein family)